MLGPDDRSLLLDALRPPEGTRLDRAVGTTFTLDLQALLVAPLAFALFDWTLGEDGAPNIVAVLESLRRYADRTTIFCQAGEIRVPRRYQPALTFLEDRVVPVTPDNPDRIFHPKAWILRFVPEDDGPVRYRMLCASRNLTFDRSWDTLLALDGVVTDRPGPDTGAAAFAALLARLAPADRPDVRRDLDQITDELGTVRFDPPDGFGDVRLHPIDGAGWPFPTNPDRSLVISPFLTAGALGRLRSTALAADVLVSRPETLDRTPIDGWDQRYVLSPVFVQPDALAPAPDGDEQETDEGGDLQGLHAKLFLFEQGDTVRLFTGSANATDAAFGGNIELLAELTATRADAGIDRMLAPGNPQDPSFRDLLDEHPPVAEPGPIDEAAEHLDRVLDIARRRLGALTYRAHYDRRRRRPLRPPARRDRRRSTCQTRSRQCAAGASAPVPAMPSRSTSTTAGSRRGSVTSPGRASPPSSPSR